MALFLVEVDEELKNLPAFVIAERKIKTVTLLERELLELGAGLLYGDRSTS